jgi:hypothetical protein
MKFEKQLSNENLSKKKSKPNNSLILEEIINQRSKATILISAIQKC